MVNSSYSVNIDDIENAKRKILQLHFEDYISEIKSKEPFVADLEIVSLGDFIKVSGQIMGIAVLQCDLCLEEFEYDLEVAIDELFAKNSLLEEYSQETELKDGQFVTDLKGALDIDIYDLLYQSVILDFPNKKVCGINCKGGDIFIRDEGFSPEEPDPRLAVFKNIKISE